MIRTLVDTGPLIAYCNRGDKHHAWSKEVFGQLAPPLWTCEAVLTEVFYRVQKERGNLDLLWDWLQRGAVRVDFTMAEHWPDLQALMHRYADLKTDLQFVIWLVNSPAGNTAAYDMTASLASDEPG